jgi:hypothetical protein
MSVAGSILGRPELEEHMSRVSTALLTVSPRSISPWGDRSWRVCGSAQLVENSRAYWLVSPTLPAEHAVAPDVVQIEAPEASAVVDSVLMMLAAWFGDEEVEGYLLETHNIDLVDNRREIQKFWELSDSTVQYLAGRLSNSLRLGVTVLEEFSLMNESVIAALRGLGFDVDVFVLESVVAAG